MCLGATVLVVSAVFYNKNVIMQPTTQTLVPPATPELKTLEQVVPLTEMPSPEELGPTVPGFDRLHPFRFGEIDFGIQQPVDVSFEFDDSTETQVVMPRIYTTGDINQLIDSHDGYYGMALAGAFDGDNCTPVWHKQMFVAHSGSHDKVPNPFEEPRKWFEGGFGIASSEQRDNRTEQFFGTDSRIGAGLNEWQRMVKFTNSNGDTSLFAIIDVAFVARERISEEYQLDKEKCGFERTTYLERYFKRTAPEPLVREVFLVFCGSSGSTFDWFSDKYIFRLRPIDVY